MLIYCFETGNCTPQDPCCPKTSGWRSGSLNPLKKWTHSGGTAPEYVEIDFTGFPINFLPVRRASQNHRQTTCRRREDKLTVHLVKVKMQLMQDLYDCPITLMNIPLQLLLSPENLKLIGAPLLKAIFCVFHGWQIDKGPPLVYSLSYSDFS